jgi:mono/diheme cytochrome c family protein
VNVGRHPALPVAAAVVAAAAAFAIAAPDDEPAPAAAPAPPPATAEQVRAGQAVFARMGCGGCHTLAAAQAAGPIGPNLDERLPSYDRAALIRKIVDPYPAGSTGVGDMPEDFGLRMSGAELEALATFLLASTRREP